MNHLAHFKRTLFLLVAIGLIVLWVGPSANAQSTSGAIAYQGELNNGDLPAEGIYDFELRLFDASGTLIGGPLLREDVEVLNGLFYIELDFGMPLSDHTTYYLDIGVRNGATVDAFTPLATRAPVLTVAADTVSAAGVNEPAGPTSVTANPYGYVSTAPLNAVYVTASGNTGLGTTNPLQRLHVIGNMVLDAGRNPVLYLGNSTQNLNRYLQLINSPQLGVAAGLKTGGLLVSSSYSYANPAPNNLIVRGKVGIGTPNPATTLQVIGSFGATGPLDINVNNRLGASPESAIFPFLGQTMGRNALGWFRPAGNLDTEMWLSGEKMIRFFTRSGQAMDPRQVLAITPNGNFETELDTRLGPSADSGDEFYFRDQYMTGTAISWVTPPGGTRREMWLSGWDGLSFFTRGDNQQNNPPRMVVTADGKVGIGNPNPTHALQVNGPSVYFSGDLGVEGTTTTGMLKITGGDLAEPFEIVDTGLIQPGMVVAIDPDNPGQMRLSTAAYDRTVAGVISGAGGIEPGVLMYKDGANEDTHPVALSGRVYVYTDATNGAIQPGDLLTTSATPGHAMKVTDYELAQGAILGKAMSGLEEGTGLVLVLVTLQ